MSDVMLYGILRMPYELAMNDEVSRFQFYKNAQRAGDRIEELESLLGDCYKIQKMQAEEVYKGNAKIEELEKIIREGIQAFGAVQEQQLKDKFEKQSEPVAWRIKNPQQFNQYITFVSRRDADLYAFHNGKGNLPEPLYTTPQTIWCDCGDAITNDSGAKCGVCARETK